MDQVDGGSSSPDASSRVDAGSPAGDAGPIELDSGVDAGPSDRCLGVDCSSLDGACTMGVCVAATGACEAVPRAAGTSCDDGDPCTTDDACTLGACAGVARDCSELDGACGSGRCEPSTGACVIEPVVDGTSCDTDPGDCVIHACSAGTCAAASAADCSACTSGGSVCGGGVCGSGPTALRYDFESGLPAGWTVGGGAGWVVDGARPRAGAFSARSGAIGHSATSSMTASFTVGVAAELAFWLYTSTESGYDYLEVWVDGVRANRWSGTTSWTQTTVSLGGPGTHVVEWRYVKDGSVSSGEDRVFVDDVEVRPAPPVESFESASLPAGWTTSGSASWTIDTTRARTGARSARSGVIGHSASTSLHRTVTLASATEIGFWYYVSTESGFDYLEFYLDGVRRDRWSGTVGWARASYPVTAGTHTLEWRYIKDGSVNSGSDAVWIDDVVAAEPASGSLCE